MPRPNEIIIFADPVFDTSDSRCTQPADAATAQTTKMPPSVSEFGSTRLPFTAIEAQSVLGQIGNRRAVLITGFEATVDSFQEMDFEECGYLHIGTHGGWQEERGESGLVFSTIDRTGRNINGWLNDAVVRASRLQSCVVVLSACQSGVGPFQDGEGTLGIAHSFLRAGATAVVATLWKISDEATAEFMRWLYGGLLRAPEKSIAEAVREAQLGMSNSSLWKSCYYWAGFTVIGDGGDIA